jgi:putative solute:sodium symporter small subunit
VGEPLIPQSSPKLCGESMLSSEGRQAYWRRNLQYLVVLLTTWFVVSFGFGILFVDVLDQIRLGGFGLGFWFAQQGSIYVFVILIFVYVRLMNKLDKEFDVDEKEDGQ